MAQISFDEVVGQDSPNSGRAKINTNFSTVVNQVNYFDTQLEGLSGGIADLSSAQTFQNKQIYSNQAAGNIGNNDLKIGPYDILGTMYTLTNDFYGAASNQKSTIALLAGPNDDHNSIKFQGIGGLEIFADNTAGAKELTFGFNKAAHLNHSNDGAQTFVINASGIIGGYTFDTNGNTLVRDKLGVGSGHSGAPVDNIHVKTTGNAILNLESTASGHAKVILDTDGDGDGIIDFQQAGTSKGFTWFNHTGSDTTDEWQTVVNGTSALTIRGDNKSKFNSGNTLGFGEYSTWADASIHLHDGDMVIENNSEERGLGIGGDGGSISWITAGGGDLTFNKQGDPGSYTGDTQDMTLKNSGNLGVGITSPASRLHIYETGDCTLDIDTNTNNNARVQFKEDGTAIASVGSGDTDGNDPFVDIYSNSATNSPFKVYTADAVNHNLVVRDGHVMMGTQTPQSSYLCQMHQTTSGYTGGLYITAGGGHNLYLYGDQAGNAGVRSGTSSEFNLTTGNTPAYLRVQGGGTHSDQPILGSVDTFSGAVPKNVASGDATNKTGAVHILGPGGLQENEINWTLDIGDPTDDSGVDNNYGINSQRGIRIGFGGDEDHANVPRAHRAVGLTAVAASAQMADTDMGFWTGGGGGEFGEKMRLKNDGTLIVNGTAPDGSEKFRVVGGARIEGDMVATGNFTVEGSFTPGPTTYNQNTYFTEDIVCVTTHDLSQSPYKHGVFHQQTGGYDKDAHGFVGHLNHDQSHYAHFQVGNQESNGQMSVYMPGTSQVIISKGTSSQRPQDGADDVNTEKGAIRYNTDNNAAGNDIGFEHWIGNKWVPVNCPPIGATYIQWWEAHEPEDLWPNTSWSSSDVSSGAFIRNAGGKARAFSGTKQDQMLLVHEHTVKHPYHGGQYRRAGRGDSRAFHAGTTDHSSEPKWDGSDLNSYEWGNLAKDKGEENRPDNETVKFWRRTA